MTLDKDTKEFFYSFFDRVLDRLDAMDQKLGIDAKDNKNIVNEERLLDNQDLCLMLNVTKRTLNRYRNKRKLRYIRVGGKILYKEADVHEFLRNHYK